MKRLQTYLSMYALLNEYKQLQKINNNEINQFLNCANPFQLENNEVSTLFINAYDSYFEDKPFNDREAYQFILLFLKELGKPQILSIFQSISIDKWLTNQQMITN